MKQFHFFFALMLTTGVTFGQKTSTTYNTDSTLQITKDPRFDELVAKQKRLNAATQTMPGYRIQIYFGAVRQKASEVKLEFASRFPGVPAYLTYQQPNFKVRVGDYRSRFEAQKFLKDIDGMFPSGFIVPEDVKLPPVK